MDEDLVRFQHLGEHHDLLTRYSELDDLARFLEIATICRAGTSDAPAWGVAREGVVERAEICGMNAAELLELGERYIMSPSDDRDPGMNDRLTEEREARLNALQEIPASIEKAESLLAFEAQGDQLGDSDVIAYVSRAAAVSSARRREISGRWFAEWTEYRDRLGAERGFFGEKFWTSRDHEEDFDDIAYLRVYEGWGLDALDPLFGSVIAEFGFAIFDALQAEHPFEGGDSRAGTGALPLATRLWLMSTSQQLRQRHRELLAMATTALHNKRDLESPAWVGPHNYAGDDRPLCAETTALAIVASQRLATSDAFKRERAESARWLLERQESDGAWADWRGTKSVLGTAAAVFALRRSGLQDSALATEKGVEWLISVQEPAGNWVDSGNPTMFLTNAVVDFLNAGEDWIGNYPQLASAVDLVERGWALAAEDSQHGKQLGVIAIFTGLESMLYALLTLDSIGAEIYRDNGNSIGFNDALVALRDWLRGRELIGSASMIPGSGDLRGLTTLRDGVVHRGVVPSPEDLERTVKGSRRLVEASVGMVLGLDPFAA